MSTSAPPPLDLNNIQGDILVGIAKKTETYYFFQIDSSRVNDFRKQLSQLVPLIYTSAKSQDDKKKIADRKRTDAGLLKIGGVNIVFSRKGLNLLGIKDNTGDTAFEAGMLAGAKDLHDNGTTTPDNKFDPDWIPAFKKQIHGLVLVSADSHQTVDESLRKVEQIFKVGTPNATIYQVLRLVGDVRPGNEAGHEHFGFLDGVSQPAVDGVDNHLPGQDVVRQGIILVGRQGDVTTTRPAWALDGSFLAFRYLPQLVPEFNAFLKANPVPGVLPPDFASDLAGARLVGRWKSGAPIDIAFAADNPTLGADKQNNDLFRYNFDFDQDIQSQARCPFAAHTRKTNPRADLDQFGGTELKRILRRGIQFGPELTAEEISLGRTQKDRGLLFAAYQSNIPNGFQFIQQSWANNVTFPPGKKDQKTGGTIQAGFDPIIGQAGPGLPRTMNGFDPKAQSTNLSLTAEWVLSKGGEYFFSPSLPTLKNVFALPADQREL
ncbi:uncharacterized protein KY384_005201 [Bacidia gigantensis]|uniref:uncharacterized protein n=1 Tax=Bacidia gigantensis TaxID=2732470 RepID=UPI001D04AC68|nr:uncharacterized protein KY384_005201 [Bacidia gigantensis]KAG8529720.1 hypothetical protein KY384_005201 [Bacidia gigantensis]